MLQQQAVAAVLRHQAHAQRDRIGGSGDRDIATVERRELSAGPVIAGTWSARRHASSRAEIGGWVTGIYADRGTEVTSGAPLMRIDGRSIQEAQVAAAAAAICLA
jgi:multidrug efflux pump subunit AcrA (membrane-fusion protein)